MGTGFPYREVSHLDEYLRMFRNMTLGCSGIRRPARPRSTSRGSPPAASTASGKSGCRRGTWPRVRCSCAKPAGSWEISPARMDILESGSIVASNGKLFAAILKILHARD